MSERKRLMKELRANQRRVERELGDKVICERCGATLETYAETCSADLADPCPGFRAIEAVRSEGGR